MKRPREVGSDFDDYARRWRRENYALEKGFDGTKLVVDTGRTEIVQRPGDEWGDVAPLRRAYTELVRRFGPTSGPVNVVEIGAGGGRSTVVMLEVLGERAGEYHVVDVSAGFVEVLKERLQPPPTVHIVEDVDLSELPPDHFDICLAQSSWSHINIYDQFRYLRELRNVLRPGGMIYVSGHFLLGTGNEWTWNRFLRRVAQIDAGAQGVVHEFTSVAALAEMLTRLAYEIACITSAGFIARRGDDANRESMSLNGPIEFPFNASQHDFLARGAVTMFTLPYVPPPAPPPANKRD